MIWEESWHHTAPGEASRWWRPPPGSRWWPRSPPWPGSRSSRGECRALSSSPPPAWCLTPSRRSWGSYQRNSEIKLWIMVHGNVMKAHKLTEVSSLSSTSVSFVSLTGSWPIELFWISELSSSELASLLCAPPPSRKPIIEKAWRNNEDGANNRPNRRMEITEIRVISNNTSLNLSSYLGEWLEWSPRGWPLSGCWSPEWLPSLPGFALC